MVHLKRNNKQIKLYEYQQIAFEKLVSALQTTFRALLVMATGLGKTFLSIEVVKYFLTPKDKVLFLCHDNGILNNAYKDYKKYVGSDYTYAKFYGDEKDWEADKHHFVFATFQSILAHLRNEKAKKKLFSPKHFTFIVVDESHHSQAETFAEVINYFTPTYKLGMTATPEREDGEDICDIFGEAVVDHRLPEAIAKGWLTPVDYKLLSDGLDDEKIREICKEVLEDNNRLTAKQINEKVFIKVRTKEQCKIIQEYSQTKKAIVFCKNIEHLKEVGKDLPDSVALHSKQITQTNDANYELFESGDAKQACVVDKFNEGIDVPDTEVLAFLRDTGSERIFLQQLGRGLRKVEGKEKVTILDFVGNIERIKQVAELVEEVERIAGIEREKNNKNGIDVPLHVEGKGFTFDFSHQVVNLLSVFGRIEKDYYPTWQDASDAVIKLGIKIQEEYKRRYSEDLRLHSNPQKYYSDFPGYTVFLGKIKKNFYPTWQEASSAVIKLGIKDKNEYKLRYKEDLGLTSYPHIFYSDYPGDTIFFGKEKKNLYPTWQEASLAVKELKINSQRKYKVHHKKDSRLPCSPWVVYPNYPGDTIFFGNEKRDFYTTCETASKAAIALNIKSKEDYNIRYKEDLGLHSSPRKFYSDFPGWSKFLGKEE